MLDYKRCNEVDESFIYEAFKIGFSDYIIKIEISKEKFLKMFFELHGNSKEHSFIALEGEKPVGIILGGIKEYEGIKTLRCGSFAIHPDYRGKEVSGRLFQLHKEEGIKNGCKQLFLEVIVGNDRAINFYKKVGYKKIYDISYFTFNNLLNLNGKMPFNISIRSISLEAFVISMKNWDYAHINWQNDVEYIEKLVNMTYYGAYENKKLAGSICISPNGKVFFLFVDKNYRLNGIGQALLSIAQEKLSLSKLTIEFPNNSSIEGFLRHLGFEKDTLSQHEMYMTL